MKRFMTKALLICSMFLFWTFALVSGAYCVQARTDNLLDPGNAGLPAWFILGAGACKFNQHRFSDACVMR